MAINSSLSVGGFCRLRRQQTVGRRAGRSAAQRKRAAQWPGRLPSRSVDNSSVPCTAVTLFAAIPRQDKRQAADRTVIQATQSGALGKVRNSQPSDSKPERHPAISDAWLWSSGSKPSGRLSRDCARRPTPSNVKLKGCLTAESAKCYCLGRAS